MGTRNGYNLIGKCLWKAGRMKLGRIHFSIIGTLCITFYLLLTIMKYGCFESITRALSGAFVVYAVGWFIWDWWAWKHPIAVKFTDIPDLNGIWKGRLYSSFHGDIKKDTEITIKQTASRFIVENKTDEISSVSFISKWASEILHKKKCLYYVYQTDVKRECRVENPIQYGTGKIIVERNKLDSIRVEYWTIQGTAGHMDLKRQI